MSDIGFAQNWCNLFFLNTTPNAKTKNYARIAAGITSASPEGNEEITQDGYYDGDGMAESEVTGGQLTFEFEGNRKYGDPAQDYIASKLLSYGEARKTDFLWIAPNGDQIEGKATITDIVPQGGDANSKSDFSFGMHYNGLPKFTAGKADTFPDKITASAVNVAVGATVDASASVLPATAAPGLVYGIDDDEIATVDAMGNVTGIKAGETELNIKSAVFPTVQETVKVTVSGDDAQTVSAQSASTRTTASNKAS